MAKLKQWQISQKRKPLILMGARQVGKTYILKQFGQSEYQNMVYLNFEESPNLAQLFVKSLKPADIISAIQIELEVDIAPGNTLIFFDEVQECPEALNSLKYFNEGANEYHVCAAGSLLGVKLINQKGFPVGKVNFLHLYPLNFIEFLQAIGVHKLEQYVRGIDKIEPLPATLHDKLLDLLKTYIFLGGMPEVVGDYIDTHDYNNAREIQHTILKAYSVDFAKHAPKNIIMKINQVWGSIPAQLAKENKKFVYSVIRSGARAKEYEEAIQWLVEAGLIYKVYNVGTPKIPLDAYANFEFFKIYFLDVGLLGAVANLPAKAIIHGNELFQEFQGSLAENYVAQVMSHFHDKLYYWTSEGKAELDFIFQCEDKIYPLEIKSGKSGHKKSLRVYAEKYQPALMVRSSPLNLKQDGNLFNCPLYLLDRLNHLLSIWLI